MKKKINELDEEKAPSLKGVEAQIRFMKLIIFSEIKREKQIPIKEDKITTRAIFWKEKGMTTAAEYIG